MITLEQVRELARLRGEDFPVSTLFLSLDGGRDKRKADILIKDLIKKQRAELEERGLSRVQRESVEQDFEAMLRFVHHFDRHGARAVAVFSSSGAGLWRFHALAQPVRDRLIVDTRAHVRPLSRLLGQFRRSIVVRLARDHAVLDMVAVGEMRRLAELRGDVPHEVKAGGFAGSEERRLERHAEDRWRHFAKSVAERTAGLLREDPRLLLVVSGTAEAVAGLDACLPAAEAGRLIARLALGPESPAAEVLARVSAEVRRHELEHGSHIARVAIREAGAGGAAIGLEPVLGAFARGQVSTLAVSPGLVRPGLACSTCHGLATAGPDCPQCGNGLLPIPDLVEELVDRALAQSVTVVEVEGEPQFETAGGIAALLRYRGEGGRPAGRRAGEPIIAAL
jgi:peptide subunit release factor 1 (eRF1)